MAVVSRVVVSCRGELPRVSQRRITATAAKGGHATRIDDASMAIGIPAPQQRALTVFRHALLSFNRLPGLFLAGDSLGLFEITSRTRQQM